MTTRLTVTGQRWIKRSDLPHAPAAGPLFHRWLPDGPKDAIVVPHATGSGAVRFWFRRFGYQKGGDLALAVYQNILAEVTNANYSANTVIAASAFDGDDVGGFDYWSDFVRELADLEAVQQAAVERYASAANEEVRHPERVRYTDAKLVSAHARVNDLAQRDVLERLRLEERRGERR